MNKKTILVLCGIFIFLYILNYLTPMSFGDDYVYCFVWQGQSISMPLPLDAARVSSWYDLIKSQWLHYFTWSGRAVAHCVIQFFLWQGKNVFNFFNAFVSVILILEIYWCTQKGKVSLNFKAKNIWVIFFALWAFTPAFSQVFFWIGGACNYVWTFSLVLCFLLPYIKKYYSFDNVIIHNKLAVAGMFLLGILAGWTNENSVCWIILSLLLFVFVNRNRQGTEAWMFTGLAGLMIGYGLLMLAPGNLNRFYLDYGNSAWLTKDTLVFHFETYFLITLFHALMWYFCLRSLTVLKRLNSQEIIKKDILLVKIICFLAFGMSAIMFFSPEFPPRSAFPETVLLIIVCGILMRLQEEHGILLIHSNAKKFLFYVGCLYFLMTASVTVQGSYDMYQQIQKILISVKQEQLTLRNVILVVKPLRQPSRMNSVLSGIHLIGYELSDKDSDWRNTAFSRYYGIKGIRMEASLKNGRQ